LSIAYRIECEAKENQKCLKFMFIKHVSKNLQWFKSCILKTR